MAASRFIRFFSRRQAKHPSAALADERAHPHSTSKFLSNGKIHSADKSQAINPIKNGLVCTVVFLDGEEVNFEVEVRHKCTTAAVDEFLSSATGEGFD